MDSKGASPSTYLPLSGGALTGPLVFKSFSEKIGTATSSGSPAIFNFDLSTGNTFTITVPTTIARFTTTNSPPITDSFSITVAVAQNNAAPYNVTAWSIDGVSVKWSGGVAPILTQTVNKIDIFAFTKMGAVWYGFIGGQNF